MRNQFNLSHLAHLSGQIGRLQTVSVIPVVPGDSLSLNLDGIIRLAPTRKEIVSECQVDITAFYVRHRHLTDTYRDWIEFIKTGPQEGGFNPFTGIPVAADYRDPFYLGIKQCGAEVNRFLVRGYNFIFNRFFQVPNTNGNGEMPLTINSLDFYPTNQSWASNMRKYGAAMARLPHILNGSNLVNISGNAAGPPDTVLTADDYGVLINDATPNVGLLDIRDLAEIQSRYRTVQNVNWFAAFYNDVLNQRWGQTVNADADKRPDMLGRATQFLSGSDVNGTDDATLGSYVGKTLDRINFNMKRRVFPEHGNVWIMVGLRYPLVHTREQHPLLVDPSPDANLWLGDPELWGAQQPVDFEPGRWLAGGALTSTMGQQPYGQEYRYQPNRIHPNFEAIPGYPFTQWDSSTPNPWFYYFNNEYADTFQTSQVGQWQAHMQVNCTKHTLLPAGQSSIFAGA